MLWLCRILWVPRIPRFPRIPCSLGRLYAVEAKAGTVSTGATGHPPNTMGLEIVSLYISPSPGQYVAAMLFQYVAAMLFGSRDTAYDLKVCISCVLWRRLKFVYFIFGFLVLLYPVYSAVYTSLCMYDLYL